MEISKEKLRELLNRAFQQGALSHDTWMGQYDTCWQNVREDMKEEVDEILQEFDKENIVE